MFSRYKKPEAAAPAPVSAPRETEAAKTPVANIDAMESPAAATMRRPAPTAPAQSVSTDKEKKRKDRMSEIKLELHRELLNNLNLAALETASEQELRVEINSIAQKSCKKKASY